MKAEKKSLKAVAVVILLAVGLIYNYADPVLMLDIKNNYTEESEIISFASENQAANFITYTTDFLKSGVKNIFSN